MKVKSKRKMAGILAAVLAAGIKTAMMDGQGVMLAVLVERVLTAATALMV